MARPVFAWGALLLWIQLIQFLEQVERVGPLISVIFNMAVDTIVFGAVIGMIAWSFGIGMLTLFASTNGGISAVSYSAGHQFNILSWPHDYESVQRTMWTMFRVAFGDFSYDFEGAKHATAAYVMFGCFLGFVLILMMNLLIAVLTAEHAKVESDLKNEFALKRARMLVRLSSRLETHQLPVPLNILQLGVVSRVILQFGLDDSFRCRVAWISWLVLMTPVLIVVKSFVYMVATVLLSLQPACARFSIMRNKDKLPGLDLVSTLAERDDWKFAIILPPILCGLVVLLTVLQNVKELIQKHVFIRS